jgi:hypothetical protein
LNENKAHDFFFPSTTDVTITPPHPKYQNNDINQEYSNENVGKLAYLILKQTSSNKLGRKS